MLIAHKIETFMIKKQVDLGKSLNRLKRYFDTRIKKPNK